MHSDVIALLGALILIVLGAIVYSRQASTMTHRSPFYIFFDIIITGVVAALIYLLLWNIGFKGIIPLGISVGIALGTLFARNKSLLKP